MPKPPRHWVGDGFHVYPVFANQAFTKEMSPVRFACHAFVESELRQGTILPHPHTRTSMSNVSPSLLLFRTITAVANV
jgi:hypothetical protein